MKVKFKLARGRAVLDMVRENATMDDALRILQDPNVLSLSVMKETTASYLKRAAKEYFGREDGKA